MRTQISRMRKLAAPLLRMRIHAGGRRATHLHGTGSIRAMEQADKKPRVDSGKVAIIGRQGSTSRYCSFSYASVLLVSAVVLLGDAGQQ